MGIGPTTSRFYSRTLCHDFPKNNIFIQKKTVKFLTSKPSLYICRSSSLTRAPRLSRRSLDISCLLRSRMMEVCSTMVSRICIRLFCNSRLPLASRSTWHVGGWCRGVAIRDPRIQKSPDIGPNIGLKNLGFNLTRNRDFRHFRLLQN